MDLLFMVRTAILLLCLIRSDRISLRLDEQGQSINLPYSNQRIGWYEMLGFSAPLPLMTMNLGDGPNFLGLVVSYKLKNAKLGAIFNLCDIRSDELVSLLNKMKIKCAGSQWSRIGPGIPIMVLP